MKKPKGIPAAEGLVAIKVASIVVHADEMTSPGGHQFDASVIRSLLDDPEVRGWLSSFDPVLLPVKRSGR